MSHAWEAVQKTVDHIEEHIGERIQIEDLADMAALSLFYYQRLFARLVKKPVREYIKLRRLDRAREELLKKDSRIIDAAVKYGFDSHETFTRAFKDAYGVTPSFYRENRDRPVGLMSFDKPNLMLHYIIAEEGAPLITDGLVLEINRITIDRPVDFVGLKGIFPFTQGKMRGEETGVEYFSGHWRKFYETLPEIPHKPGGRTVGVYYHGDAPDGHTVFFVGAETDESSDMYDNWRLPAREYAVCGFEAEDYKELIGPALSGAMKYTSLWLRSHGLTADRFFPEMYYNDTSDISYMELWVPFRKRESEKGRIDMGKYENAMKLIDEFCGNGKDNVISMATISLTEGANGNPRPSVRMVDAYYEDGVFYISSASWKNKTKEILKNSEVSVCGQDLFAAHGKALNLGWVKDEKNAGIRAKMKQYFEWFDAHADEDSPDSIVLKITLTEALITDNEEKYGERMYKVDFTNKMAE